MSTRPALQAPTFIYKCKFKPSPIPPPSHICTASPLTAQDLFGFFPFEETPAEWAPGSPESQGASNRQHRMTATKRSNHQNFVKAVHKSYETCIFFFHILMTCLSRWVLISPQREMTSPIRFCEWPCCQSTHTHTPTHWFRTRFGLWRKTHYSDKVITIFFSSFLLRNGARIHLK